MVIMVSFTVYFNIGLRFEVLFKQNNLYFNRCMMMLYKRCNVRMCIIPKDLTRYIFYFLAQGV